MAARSIFSPCGVSVVVIDLLSSPKLFFTLLKQKFDGIRKHTLNALYDGTDCTSYANSPQASTSIKITHTLQLKGTYKELMQHNAALRYLQADIRIKFYVLTM